jgi:hypothetical protein
MKARMRWFAVTVITSAVAALLFALPVAAKPHDPESFQYTQRACTTAEGVSGSQTTTCRLSPPTTATGSAQPTASPQS